MAVESDLDRVALRLDATVEAGASARRAVRGAFGERLPDKTLLELLTVVTELVNNGVEHGPSGSIELTVAVGGELIRGEVKDQGDPSKSIPRLSEATQGRAGGRGLQLVDAMTSDWWVREGSTAVVFEMPVTPP